MIAQLLGRSGQRLVIVGAGEVQRRNVDKQIGQQFVSGGAAFAALCGQAVGQACQCVGVAVQQHAQLGIELLFAIQRRRHGVEFHHRMQAQPRHGAAPFVGAVRGRVHEIQHGQQGAAAGGKNGEFVAMLAQHGVARVDHVQRRVALQHFCQHAGFLFEAAMRFGRVQKAADARGAVQPFVRGA
ncbi:hypothetical protein D3C72_1273740 [compost metagenome]